MTTRASQARASPHVPAELTGLWRREVITTPDGQRDDTTRVLWLQARSWYVDLRVPADRLSRPTFSGFADLSDAELVGLAAVQGFAGELAVSDGVCLWRRDLDQQPASAVPDEARYAVDGDVMVEDGIHADYQEIWRRAPSTPGPLAAFRLTGDPLRRSGLMVVAGDHFLAFIDRRRALEDARSLLDLVETALALGLRDQAEALLSTNICYGRLASGWRVDLANLPWLEGAGFWGWPVSFDASAGVLECGEQAWTVLDASSPLAELGAALKLPEIGPSAR